MSTAIDTTKVTNRRQLRFETLDDIVRDVEKLAAAKEIKALGNWGPGQAFKHLAIVMNSAIDGMPNRLRWHMRAMLVLMRPLFKKKVLRDGMRAGFKLPPDIAADIVPPATTTLEEGLSAIRAALKRLKQEDTRAPSPFLGKLSLDESNRLQCRHSELHLSFLVPALPP
jgi:hypothetical protein